MKKKLLLLLMCLMIIPIAVFAIACTPKKTNGSSPNDATTAANAVELSSDFEHVETGSQLVIVGYNGNATELTIPAKTKINGIVYNVVGIGISSSVSGIVKLDTGVFENCGTLKKVTIEHGIKSIGKNTFYGCVNLTDISIPSTVEDIGNNAFHNSPWYNNQPDGVVYAGKMVYTYKGEMPKNTEINDINDDTIGFVDDAFKNQSNLKSLTIPASVKSIPKYTFEECSNLSITWNYNPRNDTAEYNPSVYYTEHFKRYLKEVIVPANTQLITDNAFANCARLEKITIADSVKLIGNSAFSNCSKLESITIPSGVKSIGASAFSGCEKIESIALPQGIVDIKDTAFKSCAALKSISIPGSVKSIGYGAFVECKELENITISDSVKSIGASAFYGCKKIESIAIPKSVESIGIGAFSSCDMLKTITVDSDSKHFFIQDGILYSKEKSEIIAVLLLEGGKITLPNGMTKIERGALSGNSAITEIVLPNTLTEIGDSAFYGCTGLVRIIIPSSVKSIGKEVFYNCASLRSVIIPNTVESIGENAFYNGYYSQGITAYIETNVNSNGWSSEALYRSSEIRNCTLSSDKSYVVSLYKEYGSVIDRGNLSDPRRAGYTFGGWTTIANSTISEYTTAELRWESLNNTRIYAIWNRA